MKAQYVIDLLKNNKNRFTAKQLESATGTPRRARRALFLARKAGVVLEAIRDGGKAVIAYQLQGAISSSALAAATAAPARKASKAKTPKAAAKAKAPKVVAKTKSTEEVDAIKAKNLATMKEVTKREKTALDKIKEDTRAEFDALEAEWEAEEAARAEQLAARVAVAENLPRENVLAD